MKKRNLFVWILSISIIWTLYSCGVIAETISPNSCTQYYNKVEELEDENFDIFTESGCEEFKSITKDLVKYAKNCADVSSTEFSQLEDLYNEDIKTLDCSDLSSRKREFENLKIKLLAFKQNESSTK